MSEGKRVGVVGCGIFGAEVAISAARAGFDVTVYESAPRILSGASRNNQNRLHLGFHYPRDIETGRQSIRGFQRFVDMYPECIRGDFPNAYFIADEGSFTTPGDFLDFCQRLGMPFTPIAARDFPVEVRGASTGILCGEVVYDCDVLQALVSGRLARNGVRVVAGQRVDAVEATGEAMCLRLQDGSRQVVDAVVNCTYADINRLTAQLGHPVDDREYEYTAVPIVQLDIPTAGLTVMDGPFMTLLPHGKTGQFLLYNVEHTVIARTVGHDLPPAWLRADTAPFAALDRQAFFSAMIAACSPFVPALARARMVGCLEGPRMVLARHHATDARPSLVNSFGGRYHTVFSGKIDHCVWVAEEVLSRLVEALGAGPATTH